MLLGQMGRGQYPSKQLRPFMPQATRQVSSSVLTSQRSESALL